MKRYICLMLIALLILTAASGCAKEHGETETVPAATPDGDPATEAETDDPAYASELPELSFENETFTFLVQHDPCFRHLYDVETEKILPIS